MASWQGLTWRRQACSSPRKSTSDWPKTASRTSTPGRHARARRLQRRLSEFVFAAGVKLMERDRPEISIWRPRLHPAQARARHARRQRLYAMRMATWPGSTPGLHDRADRRPRHERQVPDRRPARRHLPAGSVRQMAGRGRAASSCPARSLRRHHGALGSFAVVYLPVGASHTEWAGKLRRCPASRRRSQGRGAQRYELPADRLGDLIASRPSTRCWAPRRYATTCRALPSRMRSHGASASRRCRDLHAPRNRRRASLAQFDAFDIAPQPRRLRAPWTPARPAADVRHDSCALPAEGRDCGAAGSALPGDNRTGRNRAARHAGVVAEASGSPTPTSPS